MSEARHWRAKKMAAERWGNSEAADEADRELRVIRVADAIRRAVDAAPPLTEDQVQGLRALLPDSATEAVA